MYKNEFDKKIGDIKKSYLLWGEEPYYIQSYGQKISKLVGDENKMVFYYDEYDFESAKNYLSQASLFGDVNLLVIKGEKPVPAKELKALLEFTKKLPKSFIIYELYSNEGKRVAKEFEADVRFFRPKEFEALNELKNIASQLGMDIDTPALKHLLHAVDMDLSLAVSELKKLGVYSKSIGTKEIDTLVYATNPVSLEKFFISLIEKKPLNELFMKIEEQEINEMKILLGIENFISQLFMFYSYIRFNGRIDSKEVLGYKLPKFIEEQRSRLAIKIKNYPDIFMTLQECEYELKTKSSIEKKSTLFSYLIKIQALI